MQTRFKHIVAQKMESAKSEPDLGNNKERPQYDDDEEFEENKENYAPDLFDQHNINSIAQQLIRSAKKPRSSKLHNRHSITVEGIEVELPRIKHHAMITRLDELEKTPKLDLRSRSVIKSDYKYETVESGSQESIILNKSTKKFMSIAEKVRHFFNDTPPRFHSKPTIRAGSKVLKPSSNIRLLSYNEDGMSTTSSNNRNIIENKQTNNGNDYNLGQNIPNINFNSQDPLANMKMPPKTQKIKILNSHDGVQVVENKELGHGGIKVQEKQLHTVPIPFSFASRKSTAIVKSDVSNKNAQWMFKARPATVLKKKPFVPKHEQKCTKAKDVCLNTERRAKEWMVFEQEIKEKFSHYEEMSKARQEEFKRQEMQSLKNLRQQTVHKPIPIKKYKPVMIRKSEKPVTVPHSPRFSIRPQRTCLNTVCE
ncbi:uncharacterized protein LOC126834612 isoform X2 [Adelges cooleyi]|uniref:uncharacterized protein LOC126834612 isoform X2 n=1 Tax=Adelges cooleyi TaxID=133065 RepID=UPI0021805ED1|nr:uncharacterized protein LOC126834612 isoform X2 [Adelges cooleyi]